MNPAQHNNGHRSDVDAATVFPPRSSLSSLPQRLQSIEESPFMCLPPPHLPPETPQEPMEFLSRSWSVSAFEVAKALHPIEAEQSSDSAEKPAGEKANLLVTAPLSFASAMTAQLVLERIMSQSDISPFASRRNSYSNGPLSFSGTAISEGSPPLSPRQVDDLSTWLLLHQTMNSDASTLDCGGHSNKFLQSFHGGKRPAVCGVSVKKWLKDMKERKKDALRIQNSQVHAAISVAGVAAALAAITAATAASPCEENQNKTSVAVASAAALVAAQCVEVAKTMGASRDQVSSVVSSAVSVKTPGDVMTLTAAAATALRAAETLKARICRRSVSHATVIPYERGSSNNSSCSGDLASTDGETQLCSQDFLRRGCEFLKRTRSGELHWRIIFVHVDKNFQVVVKSQGKYMGGTITKSKKRIVQDVIVEIPAWPGRELLDGAERRRYFAIKTDHGVMELECKNETDHRLWTEGIAQLLSRSQQQRGVHSGRQP